LGERAEAEQTARDDEGLSHRLSGDRRTDGHCVARSMVEWRRKLSNEPRSSKRQV
jgi:hypothetical protein